MTDCAEIERLLQKTGRTLKGLPNSYSMQEVDCRFKDIAGSWRFGDLVLHQSDVIELLVGALRDALDKPMQKPLTKREVHALIDAGEDVAVYCESINDDHAYATIFFSGNNVDRDGEVVDNTDLIWHSYGVDWRCWATRPTDEEREAAAWGELINGRTPEEIITGLKCEVPCSKCAYREHNFMKDDSCSYYVEQDIIALIERLESERDAALAKVPRWTSVEERLPTEEDAPGDGRVI